MPRKSPEEMNYFQLMNEVARLQSVEDDLIAAKKDIRHLEFVIERRDAKLEQLKEALSRAREDLNGKKTSRRSYDRRTQPQGRRKANRRTL